MFYSLSSLHHSLREEVRVHKDSLTRLFLLECLYQDREVSCYVFVFEGNRFCLFLRSFLLDFGLWNCQCGNFFFFLFHSLRDSLLRSPLLIRFLVFLYRRFRRRSIRHFSLKGSMCNWLMVRGLLLFHLLLQRVLTRGGKCLFPRLLVLRNLAAIM